MKFEQIILGAGLNANDYPNVSKTTVNLFDSKNRLLKEEQITFCEPLFSKNLLSYHRFVKFVCTKENSMRFPKSFEAKLTPEALTIFWPGNVFETFFRS